jgi:hypothetical protein
MELSRQTVWEISILRHSTQKHLVILFASLLVAWLILEARWIRDEVEILRRVIMATDLADDDGRRSYEDEFMLFFSSLLGERGRMDIRFMRLRRTDGRISV